MQVITLRSLYTHSMLNVPYQDEYVNYKHGDKVVYVDEAEEETHEEIAQVEITEHDYPDKDSINYTVKVIREASDHDLQMFNSYQDQAPACLQKFHEINVQHGSLMHPLRCTFSLNGNRVHFIFTAAERVDFRDFVKDLARTIKKKIYLRQIGPRDRARLVDGYGRCGRRCCCSQFLTNLDGVNMDAARVQGIVGKGSSKLLGCCGKLLCCLNYEVETYRQMEEMFPNEKQKVTLKKDKVKATVIGRDLLNRKLRLITENEKFMVVDLDEVEFTKRKSESKNENAPKETKIED